MSYGVTPIRPGCSGPPRAASGAVLRPKATIRRLRAKRNAVESIAIASLLLTGAQRRWDQTDALTGRTCGAERRDPRVAKAVSDVLRSQTAVAPRSPAAVLPLAIEDGDHAFRVRSMISKWPPGGKQISSSIVARCWSLAARCSILATSDQ